MFSIGLSGNCYRWEPCILVKSLVGFRAEWICLGTQPSQIGLGEVSNFFLAVFSSSKCK